MKALSLRWAFALAGLLAAVDPLWALPPDRDFIDRFYSQKDSNDKKGMEKTLREWKSYSPKDMEIPAAQGYLDWSQAALKEGEPLDPSETPFLKYPYWNLTPPPVRWKREVLLSVDKSWNHALQNLPDRLDLVLGLSRVDQALGRFEDQYALLAQTLQKNDRNDDICKWIPGKEAPAPPKILLANALMEAEAYYFSLGPGQAAKAARLARLAMTFNGRDPLSFNALAVSFQFQGNSRYALKYLLFAFKRDETNCMVLGNIGRLLASLGKKKAARIYFKRVVALNKDPDETREALHFLSVEKKEN